MPNKPKHPRVKPEVGQLRQFNDGQRSEDIFLITGIRHNVGELRFTCVDYVIDGHVWWASIQSIKNFTHVMKDNLAP